MGTPDRKVDYNPILLTLMTQIIVISRIGLNNALLLKEKHLCFWWLKVAV